MDVEEDELATTQSIRHDVIVVGLGAFGSAAFWRLAARGVDVGGVEQFALAHGFGSSHGTTRLFRVVCKEHPGLTPIAETSLRLWTELSGTAGQVLIEQTGCLNAGPPDDDPVMGTALASETAGRPVERLSHDELVRRFPNYGGWGADDVALWDEAAGICYPERIIRAQVAAGEAAGGSAYPGTKILGIRRDGDDLVLSTSTVEFRCSRLVLAMGAWLPDFSGAVQLRVRRTPLYWFRARPGHEDDCRLDRFPVFIRKMPSGSELWGHGSGDQFGVKIGLWASESFEYTRADSLDRSIHPETDTRELSEEVARAFPWIDPTPERVVPCMVTDSPDGQFVIGPSPDDSAIVLAGGDSAHGFKHSGGLGELVAQIVLAEQLYCDAGFLDPARFVASPEAVHA